MFELFIEGQQVDVNEDLSTVFTFTVDDVQDFGAKNTSFSKTTVLPGTKNNNRHFGNIYDVGASNPYVAVLPNIGINFNPAVSARAIAFRNNMQIFKGVMLEVVDHDGFMEYEVALFGELTGLTTRLGSQKLEDLDFSAYDHTYTIANMLATWDTAGAGGGYVYPNIDYGNYSANKHDWRVNTFRPALYAKEFIDKMFSAAGYAYDCPLFDTARFKRIVVPHTQKILTADNTNLLAKSSLPNFVDDATSVVLEFNGTGGTLGAFTTGDNQVFTFANATTVTADLVLNINVSYTGFPSDTVVLNIRKNGSSIFSVTYSTSGAFTHTVTGVAFATSDTLDFRVTSITTGQTFTYTADFSLTSFSAVPTPIQIGDTVRMNNCVPKGYLQKDFLSSILKLFNLYVFEDYDKERVLRITPFVDFYAGSAVVDWSAKVDRSKPIRVKPMSELNSRYFEFNFKSDTDYYNDLYRKRYNQGYGDYRYDSEFEFAKEVQKVELIFSGTPLVGYGGQDKIYSTIFKWNGGVVGTGEEQTDSNIRLLQVKKVTGVSSWKIKSFDGATDLTTLTSYCYAGHLDDPDAPNDDLQFGAPYELFFVLATGGISVNQFNVYWSPHIAEITNKDSRLLTCTLRLGGRDVYRLDFSRLVYIDGALFRINKIIDYNATHEGTCEGEFLKVINRLY
jgi:hypothetical protein